MRLFGLPQVNQQKKRLSVPSVSDIRMVVIRGGRDWWQSASKIGLSKKKREFVGKGGMKQSILNTELFFTVAV